MAVSSAQNLSLDIVQQIFKNFSTPLVIPIPDSDQKERQRRRGGVWNPFPWYLGQICSSWRTAFVSMYSDFWNTIHIIADCRYSPAVWDQAVSVAKVFLERTKGHPLSFSINAKHPCPPILDLFVSESMRWRDVSLCLDDEDVNIPLLWTIKNRVPQLRSLAVNIELGMPRDLPLIFEDVPALVHLSLENLGGWCADWRMLTRLELSREFNIGRLLGVLSQTTNLEQLSFNRLTVNPEKLGEKNITPLTLPRLQYLETSGLVMFKYLTTPALKRLNIYKSGEREPLDIISTFFKRSACRLQYFGCTRFFPEDFVDILPHMPDLEVLSVCDPSFSPALDFVAIMTCQKGQKPLSPKLRLLRFSAYYGLCHDQLKFRKLMVSRGSLHIMHSVQELKVIVTLNFDFEVSGVLKHPNVETRLASKKYGLSSDLPTQVQWVCDDSDY